MGAASATGTGPGSAFPNNAPPFRGASTNFVVSLIKEVDATEPSIPPSSIPQILIVGIDAPTIQGCINLVTDASAAKVYVVYIPPKTYTENLTFKPCVNLIGMTTPRDTLGVDIVGTHTYNATDSNPLNNRLQLSRIIFSGTTSGGGASFTFTATNNTEVQMSDCFVQNNDSSTSAIGVSIGPKVTLYIRDYVSRMNAGPSTGGTHFVLNGHSSLYVDYGLDANGGVRGIDILANGFLWLSYSKMTLNCADVIRVGAGGYAFTTYNYLQNASSAAGSYGGNIVASGAILTSINNIWDITAVDAASYVITGVSGAIYTQGANTYFNDGTNIRNTTIKNTVTIRTYTTALTPVA